jgi:hypothetical protein
MKSNSLSSIKTSFLRHHYKLLSQIAAILQVSIFALALIVVLSYALTKIFFYMLRIQELNVTNLNL